MTPSPILDYDAAKRKLEQEKLQLEIHQLARPWFLKPEYLSSVITLMLGFGTLIVASGTGLFDVNSKLLEIRKHDLTDEVKNFESRKQSLEKQSKDLGQEKDRLIAENRNLKEIQDRLDGQVRSAAIERDQMAAEAEVNRLVATLGSSSERERALWELYRGSKEVRSAVVTRILSAESSAELLSYRIEEVAYAASGLHSKDILTLQKEIEAACTRDLDSDRAREVACAAALASFGPSPVAAQFMVDHARNADVLEWLPLIPDGLEPPQARRILQVQIPLIVAQIEQEQSDSRMFRGIVGFSWNHEDESVRRLFQAMRAVLKLPNANVAPPAILIQYLPALAPQLAGQEARDLVSPYILANPLMDYWYDWPRDWLEPVKRTWPREMIEEVRVNRSANFTALCWYLMQWDLSSTDLRGIAAEMLSARERLAGRDASDASYAGLWDALAILTDSSRRAASAALFERLLSTRNGANVFPVPLLRAIAETHFIEPDYLSILPRLTFSQPGAYSEEKLYKALFAAFARRFPEQAMQFAIASMRTAPNPDRFRIAAEALGEANPEIAPVAAVTAVRQLRQLQPLFAVCSAFLPLVTTETVTDIMQVLRWPTCSGRDRRNLAAKIAIVKGRDFAQFRHGTAVVYWIKFAVWAESQGYADIVSQPQPRPVTATAAN